MSVSTFFERMDPIVLDNKHRELLDEMINYFGEPERNLRREEVEMYCDIHNTSVIDEKEIYKYLYSVHESSAYNTTNETLLLAYEMMMDDFKEGVKICDDELADEYTEDEDDCYEISSQTDVGTNNTIDTTTILSHQHRYQQYLQSLHRIPPVPPHESIQQPIELSSQNQNQEQKVEQQNSSNNSYAEEVADEIRQSHEDYLANHRLPHDLAPSYSEYVSQPSSLIME